MLLILGHPDAATAQRHLCHALAASCSTGAHEAGQMVRWLNMAEHMPSLLQGFLKQVARPGFAL